MVYIWNEEKREAKLLKHGLDFADAHLVYESPDKITFTSLRKAEERQIDLALVAVAGVVLVLIYIERGRNIRVISFRRASRKEKERL